MKRLLALALALVIPNSLVAQTYNQVQWGIDTASSSTAVPNIFYKVGTAWRTLTSANTPVTVYIDAFGAAGNGTTNDAAALTAAMASLGASGGVVALSCAKNYYIASNVTIPPNVTVRQCRAGVSYGNPGRDWLTSPYATQPHIKLNPANTITMTNNSGFEGVVLNSTLNFPVQTPAGYSGTAFNVSATSANDMRLSALVIGFSVCYDGSTGVADRHRIDIECDANPPAPTGSFPATVFSKGAVTLGQVFDTSTANIRTYPWGTVAYNGGIGGVFTRRGAGTFITSGRSDDLKVDLMDFGHDYGIVTNAPGNIHYSHIWSDNNSVYAFWAQQGTKSRIDYFGLFGNGARFENAGQWSIGFYDCAFISADTSPIFYSTRGCLETGAGAITLNIDAFHARRIASYPINVGSANTKVSIGGAFFENVNNGTGSGTAPSASPVIVGPAGWDINQVTFASTPRTDLPAGAGLYGGNQLVYPTISQAGVTLAPTIGSNEYLVTGTSGFNTIQGAWTGRKITLHFDNALTVASTGNIKLLNNAPFTTINGAAMQLEYDASVSAWVELWRSPPSAATMSNNTTGTSGTPIVLQDAPTITNALTVQGASSPGYVLYNTGAAANEKYWDAIASGTTAGTGALTFRMLQDGYSAAIPWLTVTRLGTSPTLAAFRGPISTGTAGSVLGTLALSGSTSGTITVSPQPAAGTYNFNLPTTAGTASYLLTSQGGAGAAMTWTDPTTTVNGVACTLGSTCTVGTSSLTLPATISGTATSGGIPYFSSATAMASSAALAQYQLVVGGGAGAAPATLGSAGTAGQLLQSGGASANPSWTTATFPSTAASGTILAAGSTNVISATATPSIGTSLTVPLISGGSAANSTLTVQSTSGAGTSDSIVFKTASQSAVMTLGTLGTTVLGTTARNTSIVAATGNLQVTNNFLTTGTSPDNWMVNTNAATDEKTWDYFAYGTSTAGTGILDFRALNDAVGAANTWLRVTRTGYAVNSIRFAGTNVGISGSVGTVPAYRLDVSGDTNTSGVYRVGGTAGLTATKTVRDAAGTGTCTLVFTGGLLTGGTC